MGTPTSITVSVDDTEYSRYEEGKDTITVTVTLSGGSPYASDSVLVELVKARRSRDAVVASETLEITSSSDPGTGLVTFYLPDIVDQDMINLVRRGKYFVKATHLDSEVTGSSRDFDIRIVTIEKFKQNYLFGIPLVSTSKKLVKNQPTNITGVTVTEVPDSHADGFGTLSYNYTVSGSDIIRTLSWKGGPVVSVNAAGTFLLKSGVTGPAARLGASSNDYIVVKVRALSSLPTSNAVDELLVVKQELDDTTIGNYLDKANYWVEQEFLTGVYLEPTNLVTDRDPTAIQYAAGMNAPAPIFTDTDWDELVTPLTYFIPSSGNVAWVKIETPWKQLIRVDSLYGAIANTRVIDIDLEWIELSKTGGLIQLVPFNQEIAFDFVGLLWVNAIRGASELPNFWHFNLIAGLRDCTPDLRDLLAKKAAIDILTALAAAFRPGVGSISLSRDGVSQSVSYTTQQQYGIYTATINAYKDWIHENEARFKASYQGLNWTVV